MIKANKQFSILEAVTPIFATGGIENTSMRTIGKHVQIASSVLYHYFRDKDDLLKKLYEYNNIILGKERELLVRGESQTENFKQLVNFQFDHAARIVAVLKYYFAYREEFAKHFGTLPPKATLHIDEVIQQGIDNKLYESSAITYSKVIAHAINGYLLEYYPHIPKGKDREDIINQIVEFSEKAISINN